MRTRFPQYTNFVLDRIGVKPSLAYSFRRLTRNYNGPTANITRVSDGETRDIYCDTFGNPNLTDIDNFVGTSSARLNFFYSQNNNPRLKSFTSVDMLIADKRGNLFTNNGRLAACSVGNSPLWVNNVNFNWTTQVVLNMVCQIGAPVSTNSVYLCGFDSQGSTYRDLALTVSANNGRINFSEDYVNNTGLNLPPTVYRQSIITGVRNGNTKTGYVRSNGVQGSFTNDNTTTTVSPNRLFLFGDPDAGGFGTIGNFAPASWCVQEVIAYYNNPTVVLAQDQVVALERDQATYYGINDLIGAVTPLTNPSGGLIVSTSVGNPLNGSSVIQGASGSYLLTQY
jgi:hypothetical protein